MYIQSVNERQVQGKNAKGVADVIQKSAELAALSGVSGMYAIARIQHDPQQEQDSTI
jgi:hypothetical protein